jgi:ribosome-associated protein
MPDHNPVDSSPVIEPSTKFRKHTTRSRSLRSMQDDVPHQATERRDPRRADLALERAQLCARIADDNRAKDILLLDLRQTTPIVDFFVIATATARRQANAIASDIDQVMKKHGEFKLGLEGSEEGRWILIDYGDFVVHIFSPEFRAYYALEDIWGDAPRLNWQDASVESQPSSSLIRPAP